MDRKDYLKLANEIYHTVPATAEGVMTIPELLKAISKFRKGRRADETYQIRNEDGFIFLNGEPAFRVAARAPKAKFSERAYYAEERCLAKAEELND